MGICPEKIAVLPAGVKGCPTIKGCASKNLIAGKGKKKMSFQWNDILTSSPYGNRTRHSSVKGRRLNRLTNEPFFEWECKNRRMIHSTKKKFASEELFNLLLSTSENGYNKLPSPRI
jgi:hypothetical protein